MTIHRSENLFLGDRHTCDVNDGAVDGVVKLI